MDPVPVSPVRPGGRPPAVLVVVVLALLAVAVVKPWGERLGTGSPGTGSPGTAPSAAAVQPSPATATATPTAEPAGPEAAIRGHCLDPSGWRVFAWEGWSGGTLRSWKSLTPAPRASGPLRIGTAPIVVAAKDVPALGFCAPARGRERPPATAVLSVWRVEGEAADPVALEQLEPAEPNPLGGLFRPAGEPTWPSGRFAFAIRAPGYERWWLVDVEVRESGRPSAAPAGATPGVP